MIDYKYFSRRYKNILITGGLGFIGSNFIFRLLKNTTSNIFNIDKLSFKKNKLSLDNQFKTISTSRYKFCKIDISEKNEIGNIFDIANPDIVFHFAAESHVDRSIDSPENFIKSNINGTFNLLEESLLHYRNLTPQRKEIFKFQHVSTDEVFGSLGVEGYFNENSNYLPTSPYSASKASSDHLVKAWFHTFKLPILMTNCSNNYGPRQFPDKLIPKIITSAINNQPISIYGNGLNIRDWLYVEDHINALLTVAIKGISGFQYCIGGDNEKSNINLCKDICNLLDEIYPKDKSYKSLIKFVDDRPGHDFRYSIDSTLIKNELKWQPIYTYQKAIQDTINWYLNNLDWVDYIKKENGYDGQRLGDFQL